MVYVIFFLRLIFQGTLVLNHDYGPVRGLELMSPGIFWLSVSVSFELFVSFINVNLEGLYPINVNLEGLYPINVNLEGLYPIESRNCRLKLSWFKIFWKSTAENFFFICIHTFLGNQLRINCIHAFLVSVFLSACTNKRKNSRTDRIQNYETNHMTPRKVYECSKLQKFCRQINLIFEKFWKSTERYF